MEMAEMVDIEEKLTAFISDVFLAGSGSTPINSRTSLLESRVVDSLGILEIIEFMEREFEITVEETEMIPENLDSIERMSRYLRGKVEG